VTILVRARELQGRPVVTLDGAEDVAEVKDVVISYASSAVVGFTLNKRGFLGSPLKEVLPWGAVTALGRDAVIIEGAGALVRDDPAIDEAASAGGERDVVGATVMTEAGTALGTVVDVVAEAGDEARVVGFEVHGPDVERDRAAATLLIPADETIALSGTSLIVPAAVEQFVRDDLAGFGSAVDDFRSRLRDAER
jgi:uncharacterized protein YrrD